MFAEQERNLKKGHDLPDAILRNVLEIHEELQAVEQSDRRMHAEKVKLDYETVRKDRWIKHISIARKVPLIVESRFWRDWREKWLWRSIALQTRLSTN